MDAARLQARIREGSQAEFTACFDEHAQAIYRFCVARSHDTGVAEDLLSVVFLEAWRCRSRAEVIEGSMRAWLFGIAHNVTRQSNRAMRRHRQALQRFVSHPDRLEPDHADDVARRVDQDQLAATLRQALSRLSPKDRSAVQLCLVADMTAAEAAAILKVPEGTVRSRLARARRQLRSVLRSGEFMNDEAINGHSTDGGRGGLPVRRQPAVETKT